MRLEQRMSALQRANAIRTARADTKRAMRQRGQEWAAAVAHGAINEPEWTEQTWRVREVLLAIPHVGPAKVDRMMRAAGIPANTGICELTERQRDAICSWLSALAERQAA